MSIIIFFVKNIPIRIYIGVTIVINMNYGLKKIKQIRHQAGLTQKQLAKLSNVSQSMITKIERGKIEPSYTIATKIFNILEEQIDKKHKKTNAKNLITKSIISIQPENTIEEAIKKMKNNAISQIPIIKNNNIIGSISEDTFIKNYEKITDKKMKIKEIMDEPFPIIPEDTNIDLIKELLKNYSAVITVKNGKYSGIITKADLLKKL